MPHTVTRPPTLPVIIDLTTVSTPKEAAITVSLGKIDPEVVEQGREARVRSLPIVGHDSECLGAISVEKLAELAENSTELTADHATIPCNILPYELPVTELLRHLRDQGVILHGADPNDDALTNGWFHRRFESPFIRRAMHTKPARRLSVPGGFHSLTTSSQPNPRPKTLRESSQ